MKSKKILSNNRMIQILRYASWGLVNTAVGFSVIIIIQFISGRAYLANAMGFAIGGLTGHYIHAKKTFSVLPTKQTFSKYILTFMLGYIINAFFLSILIRHFNPFAAQALSVTIYICYSYVMASRVVFTIKKSAIKNS
jgi:putative flippase GtrA